jgi:hypothetical protein
MITHFHPPPLCFAAINFFRRIVPIETQSRPTSYEFFPAGSRSFRSGDAAGNGSGAIAAHKLNLCAGLARRPEKKVLAKPHGESQTRWSRIFRTLPVRICPIKQKQNQTKHGIFGIIIMSLLSLHTLNPSLLALPAAMIYTRRLLLYHKSPATVASGLLDEKMKLIERRANSLTDTLKGIVGYNHDGINE